MARKKKGAPAHEEMNESWLLPYSDLMTLLLALFISLFAISHTDNEKVKQMANAFSSAFNMGGPSFFDNMGPNPGRAAETPSDEDKGNHSYVQENQNLERVQRQMNEYIQQNNLQNDLSTQMSSDGLMLRIKEHALFPSGSADLVPEAQRLAPVIAGLLASIPERVVISGYTDNVPISTPRYPSNWDLSSQRALNFMKLILASNASLNPARFSALGYSEYHPIASNDTPEGRAQNRRVEVLIVRNYQLQPNSATGGPSATMPANVASSIAPPTPTQPPLVAPMPDGGQGGTSVTQATTAVPPAPAANASAGASATAPQ